MKALKIIAITSALGIGLLGVWEFVMHGNTQAATYYLVLSIWVRQGWPR